MLHERFLFSCIADDDDDLQDFSPLQHYQDFSKSNVIYYHVNQSFT